MSLEGNPNQDIELSNKPNILLIGLNEFNRDLLLDATKTLQLPNIKRLLSFSHTTTMTDDTYESDYLEPWVQWVSIHTGKTSQEHKIKHLGDIPKLGMQQIWEVLSKQGVSSGVWGAMNASKGVASRCCFFMPDPWTFSEEGSPSILNKLLNFPRYLAKNYLAPSKMKLVKSFVSFLSFFLMLRDTLIALFVESPRVLYYAVKYKGSAFVFFTFTEYLSAIAFLRFKKKYNPKFTFLFINSIAHAQHYYWKSNYIKSGTQLAYVLLYIDKSLGKIFSALKEDDICIVANALSQKNTTQETPWILYRQYDHSAFLRAVDIKHKKVEPLMTNDAHLFFNSEVDCHKAKQVLGGITVNGEPLFLLEDYKSDSLQLFYRMTFNEEVSSDTEFVSNGKVFRFLDYFCPIVRRTGKHISKASIFCNKPDFFPNTMMNHELYDSIIGYFSEEKSA